MSLMVNEPTRWELNTLYPGHIELTLSTELDELKVALDQLRLSSKQLSLTSNLIKKEELSLLSQLVRRVKKQTPFIIVLPLKHLDIPFLPHYKAGSLLLKSEFAPSCLTGDGD